MNPYPQYDHGKWRLNAIKRAAAGIIWYLRQWWLGYL